MPAEVSATPRFMGTGDGAGPTFSSHPAGIADRARRVRLPAIEGLRGKRVLPAIWPQPFRALPRIGEPALPEFGVAASRLPLRHVITGKISDVVVPRSELS
jgi:hypothetical protein